MCKEYLEHVSEGISEEIEDFATNTVFLKSRYIFTTREGEEETGYCTHCKSEFTTRKLKHNSEYKCPSCESKCIVKQSWRGRKNLVDKACFTFYEKSVKDPNVIVARGFYAARDYKKDYKDVYNGFHQTAIYIFAQKETVMLKRFVWESDYGFVRTTDWQKTRSIYSFNINGLARLDYFCSHESIAEAIKNTRFKYSTYDSYLYGDMLKFFELYNKYPFIENLTKMGFKSLVKDKLDGNEMFKSINWRGKDIYKVLKLGRKEVRDIREAQVRVTPLFLKLYQTSIKDKSNLTPNEIKDLEYFIENRWNRFFEILQYTTIKKSYKYIKKQTESLKKKVAYYSIITTYADYLSDCRKLDLDIKRDNVLFPKDLDSAHQNTIKQVKIREDKELNIKIGKRLKKLEDKYCFENKGLVIRPAKDSLELLEEGKKLSHCVGGYAGRYARGEADILLIRKAEDPNTPYFTMEVIKNQIVQVRGKMNCSPNPEVKRLIKIFEAEKLNDKEKVKKTA